MKFKNSFIILFLLTLMGSSVIFSNFFIARMYGLLIFSSAFIYTIVVLVNSYVKNKNFARSFILILLTPTILFLGYNSHISYVLLLGTLFLFGILLLRKELMYYYDLCNNKFDLKYKLLFLLIFLIISYFLLEQLNFFSRFERFFTLRFDAGYYGRYFYYIMTSSFGYLGNSYYTIGLFFLSLYAFIKYFRDKNNLFFLLPLFITFVFIVLHVYLLDTILFIANRYVSHINLFAIISISFTVFILFSSFKTNARILFISIIYIISCLSINNIFSNEVSKKDVFANYKLGYEKLLYEIEIGDDILIGIPMRDYYLQGLNDTVRIFASHRFNDYNFDKFETDLDTYRDKDIFFIYSDIKSFHVNSTIRKYLQSNAELFSKEGNVTIYKIPKEIIVE